MTNRSLKFVGVAAWLVVMTYILVASQIGDASSGKIVGGHYFLRTKWGFNEVSQPEFIYAATHEVLFFAAIIVFGIVALRLKNLR